MAVSLLKSKEYIYNNYQHTISTRSFQSGCNKKKKMAKKKLIF